MGRDAWCVAIRGSVKLTHALPQSLAFSTKVRIRASALWQWAVSGHWLSVGKQVVSPRAEDSSAQSWLRDELVGELRWRMTVRLLTGTSK